MKAIIIGASTGIGKALAKQLCLKGYEVGITSRRKDLLEGIKNDIKSDSVFIQEMDVTCFELAREQFLTLIKNMGGLDVVIINAGIGDMSRKWERELATINTNATGFVAIANAAFEYFLQQKKGQIVGISSVSAVRNNSLVPVYSATKAFISSYMQGLRYVTLRKKVPVYITDIRPGFVDTPMTEQNVGMFWVADAEKAAKQIITAFENKKQIAYITKRWRVVAWFMQIIPEKIYVRFTK